MLAIGQDRINCAEDIFNRKNDTLFKDTGDYSFYALKYKESISDRKENEGRVDRIRDIISSSPLATEEKTAINKILDQATNDESGDAQLGLKELTSSVIASMNQYLSPADIYELDRKFYALSLTTKEIRVWTTRICKFINNQTIDYYNAKQVKVPDNAFQSEIATYQFKKNEVIADIGAGSGYFERALSMYGNHLKVYVNEISSAQLNRLATQLSFLDINDQKDISYTTILGNETSTLLPSGSCDKIIIRNTFHHFSNPAKMLEDCKRILKKNGKLYIVDILIDETSQEPACKLHQSRAVFLKILYENGFSLINETQLEYDDFKCFEFRLMQ